MRGFKGRLQRLERDLKGKGSNSTATEHKAFMKERTKVIRDYLENDEPDEPITQKELDELDPMLKDLYEKYMTEHIKGD